MRAGKPSHRVLLQKPADPATQGSDGAIADNWTTVPSDATDEKFWAQISPIRGAEALRSNQQMVGVMTTRIRVRYSSRLVGIDATWRAVDGTTIYNIVSAGNLDMANREIELMCQTGANEG